MTRTDSREAIIAAARALFSEHGYRGVTVRGIAAAAGVSPALIIKHYGSKAELFNAIGPYRIPPNGFDLPRSALGRALVQKVLARRGLGLPENWLMAAARVRESPEEDRAQACEELVDSVARIIGDTTPGRRHAGAVACQMIGLAEGLRVVGLFRELSDEELVDLYAPAVQAHIDACAPAVPGSAR